MIHNITKTYIAKWNSYNQTQKNQNLTKNMDYPSKKHTLIFSIYYSNPYCNENLESSEFRSTDT